MSIDRYKQSQELIADSINIDVDKTVEVIDTSVHAFGLSKMFENPKFSDVFLSLDDFTILVQTLFWQRKVRFSVQYLNCFCILNLVQIFSNSVHC